MDKSQTTQRKATLGTYRKVAALIPSEARVLDYGAGLCHGTSVLNAESFEPHPRAGIVPTYTNVQRIPSNTYDVVVCNCVLNVISTPSERDRVVQNILRLLKPGGRAYIMVRSWSDVRSIKHYVTEGDGCRLPNGAFQRGFTHAELDTFLAPYGHTERMRHISNVGICLQKPVSEVS